MIESPRNTEVAAFVLAIRGRFGRDVNGYHLPFFYIDRLRYDGIVPGFTILAAIGRGNKRGLVNGPLPRISKVASGD
jgi:hypothetical protein